MESLIEHPGRMTHASVAGTALEVPGDLIRLSVGIEDCDDLIDDLRQACKRVSPRKASRAPSARVPRERARALTRVSGCQLRPAGELSRSLVAGACGLGL